MSLANLIPKYRCFIRVCKDDDSYMIIGKIKNGGDLESCPSISPNLIQKIKEIETQERKYIGSNKNFENIYFLRPINLKSQDKRPIIPVTENELDEYYRTIKS